MNTTLHPSQRTETFENPCLEKSPQFRYRVDRIIRGKSVVSVGLGYY